MSERSTDCSLLALRKQLIRGDGVGLEHVEALLVMRGVALPCVLPAKRPDAARMGAMRRLLLGQLQTGPKTMRELVDHVATCRTELAPHAAYHRTGQALQKLRVAGLIRREARDGRWVWQLASAEPTGPIMRPAASSPSTSG
jgi:hypothetical protein